MSNLQIAETSAVVLHVMWHALMLAFTGGIAWTLWTICKCLFTIVECLPGHPTQNDPPDTRTAPWFARTGPTIAEVVARIRRGQVNAKAAQEAEYARDEEYAAQRGSGARARIRSTLGGPLGGETRQ